MEVSERITESMELASLGVELGVKDYTVNSILRDCHDNINAAGHRLLCVWRQEGIKQRKSEAEMKEILRNALRSEDVDMKAVVRDLKHYFQ